MSHSAISSALRAEATAYSRHCCCYCLSQEDVSGMSFTVDHIIPKSLGGETVTENLCLACWDCNLLKQSRIMGIDEKTGEEAALFHPRRQKWDEHFRWERDGLLIVGETPTGRATIIALRLNRPMLLRGRERWIAASWHPPKIDW